MSTAKIEPGTVLYNIHGALRTIESRKHDNTGWWLVDGGGLRDSVIASTSWLTLPEVLAELRSWRESGGRRVVTTTVVSEPLR
jgi:hypothetical protein